MKNIVLIAVLASGVAGAAFAETVNFDGCEGKLVPGTNYYNLIDPRCKTVSSQYETTGAEETKKAAEEVAD
jgi:hypothetical protein